MNKKTLLWIVGIGILLIGIGSIIVGGAENTTSSQPTVQPTPTATKTISPTSTSAPTVVVTRTPTVSKQPTSKPTLNEQQIFEYSMTLYKKYEQEAFTLNDMNDNESAAIKAERLEKAEARAITETAKKFSISEEKVIDIVSRLQ